MYRQEWTGLTEPQVVQGALECLEEQGWIRGQGSEALDNRGASSSRIQNELEQARADGRGREVLAAFFGYSSQKMGDLPFALLIGEPGHDLKLHRQDRDGLTCHFS